MANVFFCPQSHTFALACMSVCAGILTPHSLACTVWDPKSPQVR
jgi:hypothetical protein